MRKVTAKVKTKAAVKKAGKAKSAPAAELARAKAKPARVAAARKAASRPTEKPKSRLTATKARPKAAPARGKAAAKKATKPARPLKVAKPAKSAKVAKTARKAARPAAKAPSKVRTTASVKARAGAAKSVRAAAKRPQEKPKARLTGRRAPAAKTAKRSAPARKTAPARKAIVKVAARKATPKKAPVRPTPKPAKKVVSKAVKKVTPKVPAKVTPKAVKKATTARKVTTKLAPPATKVVAKVPAAKPSPGKAKLPAAAKAPKPAPARKRKARSPIEPVPHLHHESHHSDSAVLLRRPQVETPTVSARVLAEATARITARRARDMLPVRIATRRLVLRAPIRGDVPDLVKHADNRNIAQWLARLPSPYTRADAIAFIEIFAQRADQRPFVVTLDNALVGVVGFTYRDGRPPEVGYWLGEPFWGHGYATEAVRGLIDAAHQTGLYSLIAARSLEDNIASVKVLEKSGFKRVGKILEDHGPEKRSVLMFELEAPRWT